MRVSTVQDVSPLDDGLSWRKYGQKDILGAKYPRSARRRRTILFQPIEHARSVHAHERC